MSIKHCAGAADGYGQERVRGVWALEQQDLGLNSSCKAGTSARI